MALYFECRINEKSTPSDCFFSDFVHWVCIVQSDILCIVKKKLIKNENSVMYVHRLVE